MDRALRTWGVPPERLVIEIHETALAGGIEQVKETLARLKALGLRAGDRRLRHRLVLPEQPGAAAARRDEARRDVRGRHAAGPLHAKIVRSLVQLAQNLGLRVTAEGVEDGETALALSTLGCERIQGGYVGLPIGTLEVLTRCGPQDSA